MNAIDTNVIAYSVDTDARVKRPRALSFLASLDPAATVVPWQVVCELGSVLNKFFDQGRTENDPTAVIGTITSRFRLAMPSENLVFACLNLQRKYQLSYWDALLLAACVEVGVTRLYTEDIQSRPVIEGIEIVDPFKPAR